MVPLATLYTPHVPQEYFRWGLGREKYFRRKTSMIISFDIKMATSMRTFLNIISSEFNLRYTYKLKILKLSKRFPVRKSTVARAVGHLSCTC